MLDFSCFLGEKLFILLMMAFKICFVYQPTFTTLDLKEDNHTEYIIA